MSRIDEEALAWVARQSGRPLSDAERVAFEAWYGADSRHQGAYLRAHAIWLTLDQTTIQHNLRPTADRLLADQAASSRIRNRRAFLTAGIAAAAVAGIAGVFVAPALVDRTVLKTATGEFRKIPLADRSIANLSSDSHVEVDMTRHLRRIVLKHGEAWFDVAKDPQKPFVVEAGDVRVQAVGTAFSVRRRHNGADVLVTEGTVEAWSDADSALKQRITAGQEAFVPDRAVAIAVTDAPADVERKLAWRDGNLIFQNETLADAVADFNRYNTQQMVIIDPSLRDKRLIGQYRIDQPQRFADDVHSLFKVPVSVDDDGIRIGVSALTAGGNISG